MPSTNKTVNIGLNLWQGNEYPKRQDFLDDNQAIDTEIGNLKKIAHGAVADLAALKAIDTTNLSDNITIIVKTLGFYRFDSASTLTADDNSIVQPTTGSGRWINDLASHKADKATQTDLGHVKVDNDSIKADVNGVISAQKPVDYGRYQSDFVLDTAVLSNTVLNNDSISLITNNPVSTTATYSLGTGNSTSVHQVGIVITTKVAMSSLTVISSTGTTISNIYVLNPDTGEVLSTNTVSSYGTYTINYNFLADTSYAITTNSGSFLGSSSTPSFPIVGDAFNVTSGYSSGITASKWFVFNSASGSGMLSTLTGTVTKTYTPSDLKKWGNVKWTQTTTAAGSTVTCNVYKSDGTTLLLSNVTSIADLSSIDIVANPTIVVKWTLTRLLVSDTSPTVSNASVTWEGKGGDGAWEKIANITLTSDTTQVDFTSLSNYKKFKLMMMTQLNTASTLPAYLRFNDDTNSSNYYTSYKILDTTYSQSSNPNSAIILDRLLLNKGTGFSLSEFLIDNIDIQKKNVLGSIYSDPVINIVGGYWVNKVDLINKISIIASAQMIGTGSKLVLWGCK